MMLNHLVTLQETINKQCEDLVVCTKENVKVQVVTAETENLVWSRHSCSSTMSL